MDRVGRHHEALTATQEAVALYRDLATTDPTIHTPNLAIAVRSLGGGLDRVGRHHEALTAYQEAVALYRPLADELPAVYAAKLGEASERLRSALRALGREEDFPVIDLRARQGQLTATSDDT